MIQVAVMGHGVVGSGVAEILIDHPDRIQKAVKTPVNLKYILDIREFDSLPYREKFTKDFSVILNDPEVLEIGRICLLAFIVIGPFIGFYQICTTYLQASGKSKEAVIVSLLEKGIIYIPMIFLMNAFFKMYGIIFSATVTTVLSAVAALIFCYKDYWNEVPLYGYP